VPHVLEIFRTQTGNMPSLAAPDMAALIELLSSSGNSANNALFYVLYFLEFSSSDKNYYIYYSFVRN